MWSRKIWREIDMRQKINHPFYYPMNNGDEQAVTTDDRKSLIDVIYGAVLEGTITAYGSATYDDEFRFISKEALLLITKATELFVTDLAGTCGRVARNQKRKTM